MIPARDSRAAGADAGPRAPRVGVSRCLLGERVRWDAGHRRDSFVVEELGRRVELVAVCPELEIGLGVPREPIELRRSPEGEIRLVTREGGEDLTHRMDRWALARVEQLRSLGLCGYVLKAGSPSCGWVGVEVRRADGGTRAEGQGRFARALARGWPELPVEEEVRLRDPAIRGSWLARVLALYRQQKGADPRAPGGGSPPLS